MNPVLRFNGQCFGIDNLPRVATVLSHLCECVATPLSLSTICKSFISLYNRSKWRPLSLWAVVLVFIAANSASRQMSISCRSRLKSCLVRGFVRRSTSHSFRSFSFCFCDSFSSLFSLNIKKERNIDGLSSSTVQHRLWCRAKRSVVETIFMSCQDLRFLFAESLVSTFLR